MTGEAQSELTPPEIVGDGTKPLCDHCGDPFTPTPELKHCCSWHCWHARHD